MSDLERNDSDGDSSNTSRRSKSKLRRRRRHRGSRTSSVADNAIRDDPPLVIDLINDTDQTPTTSNASNVPNGVSLIVQSRRDGHRKHGGDADSSLGDAVSACSSASFASSVSTSSTTSKMFSFFSLWQENLG